jgi:hypothetical protein
MYLVRTPGRRPDLGDTTVAFGGALEDDAAVDDLDAGHGAWRGPSHVVHAIGVRKRCQVADEAVVRLACG